ncbi:MAG TPA: Rrf2 family transcriptional regulator [Methylomirabilota bacterium]|nr:Rrf2 family transcriptional regulator [Methylomirabilota bacterium]
MRISAKGEYAIKAMLDLAMHRGRALVPIQEIAVRQAIPQRYLEQVLLALKRAGLLTSKRGSTGGYHLSTAPDEITVGAILRAVEGGSAPFEGIPQGRRNGGSDRDLGELWAEIAEAVGGVVDRWTLGDLTARAEERRGAARPMYHI